MASRLAFLRRKPDQRSRPSALVASGRRIDATREEAERLKKRRQAWWEDAWLFHDEIGEIKYAIGQYASSMSKLRIYAAERTPQGEIVETSEARAVAAAARLDRGPGWSEILRLGALQYQVPGEAYLVGRDSLADGESWEVASVDEVSWNPTSGWQITVDEGKSEPVGAEGMVVRLWAAHPRRRWRADSPMRGVLSSCEEIIAVESAFRAVARSRAHAGIFGLPSELDYGRGDAPTEGGGDGADAEQHPLMRDLIEMMSSALGDPDSAAALVPWIVEGPGEWIEKMRHIPLGREIGDLITRLDSAIGRVAGGLNLPKELLTGIGDVNHWSAWMIDESMFKAHVEPGGVLLLASITSGYFRPALAAAGVDDPGRFLLWYDAADLVVRPNRATDADTALDRDAISLAAYRAAKGFGEDEAPDEEEVNARVARKRGAIGEGLTVALLADMVSEQVLARLEDAVGIGAGTQQAAEDAAAPAPENGPPPSDVTPAAAAIVAAVRYRSDLGSRLAAIDKHLAARLSAACESALRRAIERAGAQLRTRAGRDKTLQARVRGYDGPAERFGAWLGREQGRALLAAGDLPEDEILDGAFAALRLQWDRMVPAARRQAVRLLKPLLGDEAEALALDASSPNVQAGWARLERELRTLAAERLWDPSPRAAELGEIEAADAVPFRIIREALQAASGGTGEQTGWDGVAVSEDVRVQLAASGAQQEAWQWEYGEFPRERPFEPHERLDGLVFENFDDPRLANPAGWPPGGFYAAGDHAGCLCNVIPVLVLPGEEEQA